MSRVASHIYFLSYLKWSLEVRSTPRALSSIEGLNERRPLEMTLCL
jgi:hypothetical protein